ncbi:DUF2812 domain-containing protein [Herbiconiux sp. KACC 21604]|uniref:DUF2812 domain-containing protein n=1 Tax=unclassified Herbiconiux TaxID=2618217 RepID=UPI0014917A8A|nr:DUF2812 domain-containing protein [Herbiconiux sp. SALV-R1]QJU55082.1 DUF2812 domain-containing protein [Herbiconiux sp. SALV-R1]WPO86227.1 DUF2812 domain-containing protein [Herbiconiux sp. KACC 21604]
MNTSFKIFADFDKEERWLNRQAAEGRLVHKAGPLYAFAPVEPGSAVVRVDYRPTMSAADFDDYVTLFADAGWRHLAGTRTSGTQYFASSAERADTEIFSDPSSRALRYRRALGVTGGIAALYLLLVFVLVVSGNSVFESLFTPGAWYLTPGLWQKEGWALVGAFLFETPFVILRIGAPVLLVAACIVMLATVAHQWRLYRRATV